MPANTVTFSASHSYEEALQRAADAWGVEPSFWDIFGTHRVATREALISILSSLKADCETTEHLDAAREARLWEQWSRLAPPTVVTIDDESPSSIVIHIPQRAEHGKLQVEIVREDGFDERATVALETLPIEGHAELRGLQFQARRLPLPADLPLGYHRLNLRLSYGDEEKLESETHVIHCPSKAYLPGGTKEGETKQGGIAVSLYGLRSARNWGCGDCTDLERFCEWAAKQACCSFVALNPLHSIPNRQPYNTSPYLPNCFLYRNYIYLDIERIAEFASSREAQSELALPETQAKIRALREAKYVEYEKVANLKLQFLKLLYRQFLKEVQSDTPRAREFREYCETEGEPLRKFALYSALDETIHSQNPDVWLWRDWPAAYRNPDSAECQAFAEEHRSLLQFYQYVQWQVDMQLAAAQSHAKAQGMAIGLYHDLALATDQFGSDLWAYPDFYVPGCRVGAPPDGFSPKGQDWCFPPPNSEKHWATGYRLFRDSIRKNSKHGGALRIDHVMRFFRLYWIPPAMDATQGAYVTERFHDLVGILALESVRQKVIVIGEDLGTVAPHVRETLGKFGILSYRLMYFEKNAHEGFKLPQEYPWQALVSASTHDLPTLAGFWTYRDIDVRREAGLLPDDGSYGRMIAERNAEKQKMLDAFLALKLLPDWFPRNAAELPEFTGELHYAAIGFLVSTPSMLMVLNQEDLFKDPAQQNLPGSTEQYPNWRHKVRYTLEELESEPLARDYTRMFKDWLIRAGRA